MISYPCTVALVLWLVSSSTVAINAKEDIDLRRSGAQGLLMRRQEERRIHEGRELVSDESQLVQQIGGGYLSFCCNAFLSLTGY